jgi:hypothetical protein
MKLAKAGFLSGMTFGGWQWTSGDFRREPLPAADYAERALEICEEQRIAQWYATGLCADGWALVEKI